MLVNYEFAVATQLTHILHWQPQSRKSTSRKKTEHIRQDGMQQNSVYDSKPKAFQLIRTTLYSEKLTVTQWLKMILNTSKLRYNIHKISISYRSSSHFSVTHYFIKLIL